MIKLHLDNDRAGRDTIQIIHHHLNEQYEIYDCSPKNYKDINELLIKKITTVNQINI